MGAAASASYDDAILMELRVEQSKPEDASDIENLDVAKYKIQNLRRMIRMVDFKNLGLPDERNDEGDMTPSPDYSAPQVDKVRGQAIVNVLAEKIEQRYSSLRDVFLKMDVDKSGYISMAEFQERCSHWGINLSDEDFINLNSTYIHQESALQNDHGINYNEFINLMTHSMNYKEGEGEKEVHLILSDKILDGYDTMKQAFKSVDKDSSGTVERGELNRVFESFDVGHTQSDIDALFAEYDKNGDGVFSYGEFVKMLHGTK